jgi:hypothetical protein
VEKPAVDKLVVDESMEDSVEKYVDESVDKSSG